VKIFDRIRTFLVSRSLSPQATASEKGPGRRRCRPGLDRFNLEMENSMSYGEGAGLVGNAQQMKGHLAKDAVNHPTLAQQLNQLAPMIEALHDFANRFTKLADGLIGSAPPQDASAGRAQTPTVPGAPLTLQLQRIREDLESALSHLSDPLQRLEGRV
jgi:hypothetical protein